MVTANFYKDCLSEELQSRVSAQLKLLTSEQLSLNEEVAVHRTRCADTVKAWSKAREAVKSVEEKLSKSPEAHHDQKLQDLHRVANAHLRAVGEQMADAMKMQKDMIMSAVVADKQTRETLTENTLMLLMNAVIDLVHNYFNEGTADSIQTMARFEDELRSRVVFQEADEQALAIEYEFGAMLDTVPGAPELETQSELENQQQLLENS
jgi:hypothetical protein